MNTQFLRDHGMTPEEAHSIFSRLMHLFANGFGLVSISDLMLPSTHPSVTRSIDDALANRGISNDADSASSSLSGKGAADDCDIDSDLEAGLADLLTRDEPRDPVAVLEACHASLSSSLCSFHLCAILYNQSMLCTSHCTCSFFL